jgi:hypothetical protein
MAMTGDVADELRAADEQTAKLSDTTVAALAEVKRGGDRTAAEVAQSRRRLETLHRMSALSEAYRLSSHQWPDTLIALVTVERSGSTAMFDLLRSHPDVYVEHLSFLWEEMGFQGRRYPTSLSDQGRYTTPVEVQPRVGARIPVVEADTTVQGTQRTIAIEKAHPQFFDYDPGRLTAGIARLHDRGTDVDVVVQVRRPLEVMWSMAEYKRREPAWYASLDPADIPAYVLASFRSLRRIADEFPSCRIIDNSDLIQVSPRLVDLVEGLAPIVGEPTGEWVSRTLEGLTNMQRTTRFVADRDAERSPRGPDDLWVDAAGIIDACTVLWDQLV